MKNLILFCIFGMILGCAPSTYKFNNKIFLPSSTDELTKALGTPLSTQAVPGQSQGQLLTYPEGTYQVEKDKVQALLKPATGNESKLQYWLQQWKGQAYTKSEIETVHGTPKTIVYKNSSAKTAVIYSAPNDEVQKVIYEK